MAGEGKGRGGGGRTGLGGRSSDGAAARPPPGARAAGQGEAERGGGRDTAASGEAVTGDSPPGWGAEALAARSVTATSSQCPGGARHTALLQDPAAESCLTVSLHSGTNEGLLRTPTAALGLGTVPVASGIPRAPLEVSAAGTDFSKCSSAYGAFLPQEPEFYTCLANTVFAMITGVSHAISHKFPVVSFQSSALFEYSV